MFWIVYSCTASLAAIGAFLGADWFRDRHLPAPDNPGLLALLAGLLWPLVIIGLAQLGCFVAIRKFLLRRHSRVRSGTSADTKKQSTGPLMLL